MAAHGETRNRILDTAAGLFQRQGYHATGMNQILAEGKAPKGSMYFHFPGGKEQLAAEAVERSSAEFSRRIDAVLEATTTPAEAVAIAAAGLADGLIESGYTTGCPIAMVALETASTSEPVRESCRAGYQVWIDRLSERMRAAGIAADTAEQLAVTAIASLEGALLLARVRRDVAPLHTVATQLASLIDTATP